MRSRYRLSILVVVFAAALPLVAHPESAANTTLQNLQTAYNGESNAQAKYLEFAKQAGHEGYEKVASLFRATAGSEEIHRSCEGAIIEKMGATPHADIKLPPIKSTKLNLEDSASRGEAYERDTMYPRFIRQARKDGNNDAAQCFSWARAAEAEHYKLFITAARDLDQMKAGGATYYVCTEGGYTMARLDVSKCAGVKYHEVK
jgi:rubrerythrin